MKTLFTLILVLFFISGYSQDSGVYATLRSRADLTSAPDSYSVIGKIKKKKKILITGYHQGHQCNYFEIKYGTLNGYVEERKVQVTDSVETLRNNQILQEQVKKQKRQSIKEIRQSIKEIAEKEKLRKKQESLRLRYGNDVANKILKSEVSVGMTTQMVIASWGEPFSKRKSEYVTGMLEQWLYYKDYDDRKPIYISIQNGVVIAVQHMYNQY